MSHSQSHSPVRSDDFSDLTFQCVSLQSISSRYTIQYVKTHHSKYEFTCLPVCTSSSFTCSHSNTTRPMEMRLQLFYQGKILLEQSGCWSIPNPNSSYWKWISHDSLIHLSFQVTSETMTPIQLKLESKICKIWLGQCQKSLVTIDFESKNQPQVCHSCEMILSLQRICGHCSHHTHMGKCWLQHLATYSECKRFNNPLQGQILSSSSSSKDLVLEILSEQNHSIYPLTPFTKLTHPLPTSTQSTLEYHILHKEQKPTIISSTFHPAELYFQITLWGVLLSGCFPNHYEDEESIGENRQYWSNTLTLKHQIYHVEIQMIKKMGIIIPIQLRIQLQAAETKIEDKPVFMQDQSSQESL